MRASNYGKAYKGHKGEALAAQEKRISAELKTESLKEELAKQKKIVTRLKNSIKELKYDLRIRAVALKKIKNAIDIVFTE